MSAHTSGPWEPWGPCNASADFGSQRPCYEVHSSDGISVVAILEWDRGDSEAEATVERDARLIAAAPELLEAALVRVSWGHGAGCNALDAGPCVCGHDALVAAAKKTQGES